MENFQKKIRKRFFIECKVHLMYHMFPSLMNDVHIRQNMNDLSQIWSVDIKSLIWRMMHFSNVYRTSPQSKCVDLVSDIDLKKSIFLYWYEERILANLHHYLSKNHENFSKTFSLPRKKNKL